jgi:hypothetical protein
MGESYSCTNSICSKRYVSDNFDALTIEGAVPNWNIYAPKWAPIEVVKSPNRTGKALQLSDTDLYDYARAIRVFQEGTKAQTSLDIFADTTNTGRLEIDLTDQYGNRPVEYVLMKMDKSLLLMEVPKR